MDTDYGYVKLVRNGDVLERVWDEEKIASLLEKYKDSHLFISGCYSNQGKFYRRFDRIVLLKATCPPCWSASQKGRTIRTARARKRERK